MSARHKPAGGRRHCGPSCRTAILANVLLFATTACSTMNPVEMSPEEVQMKILSENILEPGKHAKIVTIDGRIHDIRVDSIDGESGTIETDSGDIPVIDIVAVETRDFSMGKTALLAAGSYAVLGLIAIAIGPALLL